MKQPGGLGYKLHSKCSKNFVQTLATMGAHYMLEVRHSQSGSAPHATYTQLRFARSGTHISHTTLKETSNAKDTQQDPQKAHD